MAPRQGRQLLVNAVFHRSISLQYIHVLEILVQHMGKVHCKSNGLLGTE